MKVINISKNRFKNLERYQLPPSVFNTEAEIYILPIKNKWLTINKILKRLYINTGPMMGNKLQTINSLIYARPEIDIQEMVFPEKLAIVGSEIVGYTMDLIESTNLEILLRSDNISPKTKINYLKQVGEILEKMKKVRQFTQIKDFYLNDLHENNFIVDIKTDSVRVVDMDSCKINGNYTFGSRYLSPTSMISNIGKYKHEEKGICGGYLTPSEDTDLYCYTMMILNTIYGGGFNRLNLEEFYNYLEYLSSLGLSREIIDSLEKIASNNHNENPYEMLDELIPIMPRSNKYVYQHVRKK